MSATLLTLLTLLALATTALAADTNEIANAIRDLGAADHKTREAATKFLSTAGKAAVPALEQAAQSKDPEIRLRAAELLPAARLGLPADFPADLRAALTDYPKASVAGKQATVGRVIKLGGQGRPILFELARSEKDLDARISIFGPLLEPTGEELNRRLEQAKLDEDAVTHIVEGLEFYQVILPEDTVVPMKVIQRLDAQGFKKQADEAFERTYRLQDKFCTDRPRDPEPHNNLAWLCAVSHRRLDDGLKAIEQALAETPGEAALLDTQAELYFQKGDKERALELIAKCVAKDPNTAYFRQQQERIKKGDKSVPPPEPEQQ